MSTDTKPKTIDERVRAWIEEEQEETLCSLCLKPTKHYCSTLACPDCHVSLTFEDCVRGTVERDARDETLSARST